LFRSPIITEHMAELTALFVIILLCQRSCGSQWRRITVIENCPNDFCPAVCYGDEAIRACNVSL